MSKYGPEQVSGNAQPLTAFQQSYHWRVSLLLWRDSTPCSRVPQRAIQRAPRARSLRKCGDEILGARCRGVGCWVLDIGRWVLVVGCWLLGVGHVADSIPQNKNCRTWAHEWVKRSLPGLKIHGDGIDAEVTEITNVSGDCDLGQRKGK